jgi:superfamily II DNA or RNA helicase
MNWEKGIEVRRLDNPGKVGSTTGQQRERSSGIVIQIKWHLDGSTDYVAEDQVERIDDSNLSDPYVAINAKKIGRSADFRRSLTQIFLSGRLANLVYSMGITQTDFYAHQYKPLMTLLDSPANGLLIADEVGLGKTIEAGLIWTELRAREDMRRLLIVCPAMLREKWQDELKNRFGISAQIVNAKTLTEELRESSASGPVKAWITSYQAIRPPKSWKPSSDKSEAAIKGKSPQARSILASLLDENEGVEPLIDVVVFDEAHYMRNPDSSANRLGELLREVSNYRILLSATPVNLHNRDLFQLLHLCDPDHFQYESSFYEMIQANQPLVKARDAALNTKSSAEEIIQHLQAAVETSLLSGSHQLSALLSNPPTDSELQSEAYRADLASSLERVNLLGHVLTRTRKRDVQMHRPIREVRRESVPMTEVERSFYEFVTEATRDYAWRKGISDGFLLATPQRQVCSCPAAFAKAWLGDDPSLLEDLADVAAEDAEDSDEDAEYEDISDSLKEFLLQNRPRNINLAELEKNDSKLNRLLEVTQEYFKINPKEKIILFTAFRGTAHYLQQKLTMAGSGAMLLWGGLKQTKQQVIEEFASRDDVRVLVATEVASEGVDLQFCKVLINYDLPWNPMRVEQRIGRIDRLGQVADKIHIWNLFYKETIDERILGRLLERLGIFKSSMGDPEPIIGEQIQRLEAYLLTAKRTPEEEEAEINRTAQTLENIRQKQEELAQNAAQMIAHGGLILNKIDAANEISKRVTEQDLIIYVQDFLIKHAQGHHFSEDPASPGTYTIQLPAKTAAVFDEFIRTNGMIGQTQLSTGVFSTCKFLNKIASQSKRGSEIIHQFHPLIRFIASCQASKPESNYPWVSLSLRPNPRQGLKIGSYFFVLRRWSFEGVKSEELLASSVYDMDRGLFLERDESDALINDARLNGTDWLAAAHSVDPLQASDLLDQLEDKLNHEYLTAVTKKENENKDRAMFQLHGINQHLENRVSKMRITKETHELLNRSGLAKATQARIDKLTARLEMKREQVRRQEKVTPNNDFVCCGILKVTGDLYG